MQDWKKIFEEKQGVYQYISSNLWDITLSEKKAR